jgi:hypothetical protein
VRYWLYKCNIEAGPAGYWGDWRGMVFNKKGPVQWGGDYSTRSPEVSNYLASEVSADDVIVAYQTNLANKRAFTSMDAFAWTVAHACAPVFGQYAIEFWAPIFLSVIL